MRLWIAAAIIAIVLVAGFVLSAPRVGDLAETRASAVRDETPTVTLRDTFKKGVHTITGSIDVPNVCTSVTAVATRVDAASSTEGIRIAISLIKQEGICLQLPTSESFSTTITAPAGVSLSATVNGTDAITTVL